MRELGYILVFVPVLLAVAAVLAVILVKSAVHLKEALECGDYLLAGVCAAIILLCVSVSAGLLIMILTEGFMF